MASVANKAISIGTNTAIRLEDVGDGTYKLSLKQVSVGATMATNDKMVSLFGINIPIWLISNGDGTYSIAVSTPVTPTPTLDIAASILGTNVPIRLVYISPGLYALGVSVH